MKMNCATYSRVYQLRMAQSNAQEHTDADGGFEILISDEITGLLCAKIQSRHIPAKQYRCWVSFGDRVEDGWFCKCKAGTSVVGMCGHVTNIIRYLSFGRHQDSMKGVLNWTAPLEDASDIPAIIDEYDIDEDDNCVEE